jgi:hypothetical protein
VGCPPEEVEAVLAGLGFVRDGAGVFREHGRRGTPPPRGAARRRIN